MHMMIMFLDQVEMGLFFMGFANILTEVPCRCTV